METETLTKVKKEVTTKPKSQLRGRERYDNLIHCCNCRNKDFKVDNEKITKTCTDCGCEHGVEGENQFYFEFSYNPDKHNRKALASWMKNSSN